MGARGGFRDTSGEHDPGQGSNVSRSSNEGSADWKRSQARKFKQAVSTTKSINHSATPRRGGWRL